MAFGTLETQRWEKDGQKHSKLKLNVSAVGPELSFATVEVKKMTPSNARPGDDEWNSASKERPADRSELGTDENGIPF